MNKLKEFFEKLLKNKKLLGVIGGIVLALIIAGILISVFAGGQEDTPDNELEGCTVTVKSEGGKPLADIGVYVYTDATMQELISFVKTDAEGVASITEALSAGSVAVLQNVPAGYRVEENYTISQPDTSVVLPIELLSDMTDFTFKLGGVMFDFTVTTPDGTAYTLSELLKEKKAVMLNLWYTGCEPCKAEFPYLQRAYNEYSDTVEVLALDPMASDDATAVAAFQTANSLTFPVAKCGEEWAAAVPGIMYPTTIVIDRFGTIALMHTGAVDNAKTFKDVFAYFTADGYVQTTVKDIRDLLTAEDNTVLGTQEDPEEFGGVTSFEVTVEPGKTYYCNVYRVSGMEMTVQSQTLKLTWGETVCEPVNGTVSLLIPGSTDPNTPVALAFANTGTEIETYKVSFHAPAGSVDNPHSLTLGDFTAEITAGNSQGVYYTYTASESGKLTVKGLNVTEGVKYSFALNNLTQSLYYTLEENGQTDAATGEPTLSVPVNAGDAVQLIVSVTPNENNEYPAASIQLSTAIEKEEQGGEADPNNGGTTGGNNSGTTGGNNGGTTGGNNGGTTGGENEKPVISGTLVNPDEPEIVWGFNDFEVSVGAGERKLYNIARSVGNATLCIYDKDAYVIYKGKTYTPDKSGAIYIYMKSEGSFSPLALEIGNMGSAEKNIKAYFAFTEGSRENPYEMELGEFTVEIGSGNEQGVFYTYKATQKGTLTLEVLGVDPENVKCGITISDQQTIPTVVTLEEQGENGTKVSIELPAGAVAEIIFGVDPGESFKYSAASIRIKATFE